METLKGKYVFYVLPQIYVFFYQLLSLSLYIYLLRTFPHYWGFSSTIKVFLDHIQLTHRVGLLWTSEGLYLHRTTQHRNTRKKHQCPQRVRTRDPINQAAADLRLRPRGHRGRHIYIYIYIYTHKTHTCIHTSYILCFVRPFFILHSEFLKWLPNEWCVAGQGVLNWNLKCDELNAMPYEPHQNGPIHLIPDIINIPDIGFSCKYVKLQFSSLSITDTN
jgi:hypothetical protein